MTHLFIDGNLHQGYEHFNVQSRGKQCAFMSLLAVLTAENFPTAEWSKSTLDNVLLRGDKLYKKALNSRSIVLDPGVEFLSAVDLPRVVSAACVGSMFSCKIELPILVTERNQSINGNNNKLPVVEEPVKAHNYV